MQIRTFALVLPDLQPHYDVDLTGVNKLIQRRELHFIAVLTVAVLSILACRNVLSQSRQPTVAPNPVALPQPDTLVPFTADLVKIEPHGQRFEGTFHRASDGSIREDGVLLFGSSRERVIAIVNVPENRAYFFRDGREGGPQWKGGPTGQKPAKGRPPKWRSGTKSLSANAESHQGLLVYRYATRGDFELLAARGENHFSRADVHDV